MQRNVEKDVCAQATSVQSRNFHIIQGMKKQVPTTIESNKTLKDVHRIKAKK